MTDTPMPKLPGPPLIESLGQMIDNTSRLLGRVSRNIDGCLVVGYPVPVDALERKAADVASLKTLAEGLRGQVQAAEVLIGAIRDELGAKKGDDLVAAIRHLKTASQIDGDREALAAELDEVSEILSHGVDKPGTAIEMARALLERATRAEQLPEGQEARAVPRRLGRYGAQELWTAGDWLIHVRPRDARYTDLPNVQGYVHGACEHHYAMVYHRIKFADDPEPAEAVARWIEDVKRANGGIDVVFGPFGREPLLDPTATHANRVEKAKGCVGIDGECCNEPAAEVNEANTLRVVSPLVALKYATAGSSGIDLPLAEGARLLPGQTRRLRTGVRVQIPPSFEGQVRPRSSSSTAGLYVALGTIDSDYRGEIEVILRNERMSEDHILERGARVAQLVICPVARPQIVHVESLDETERGECGFGSTGP